MNTGVQSNCLLVSFLVSYALAASVRVWLNILNLRHLQRAGRRLPEEFAGVLDQKTREGMRNYAMATGTLGAVEHLSYDIFLLALVLVGGPPVLASTLASWDAPMAVSGTLFFLAWYLIMGAFEIPFDLYRTFGIERRFSFSTISWPTWLADLLKSALVSAVVLAAFLLGFFSLVEHAPRTWWLWGWLFFVGFQLLVSWLYPVVISPLFNRFEPIEDRELARDIASLAQRSGISVTGIYQMDALKRSRHSNAYFTGIGRSKRIVLFDALLKNHPGDEILAILAHELGHWKLGHVTRQMVLAAAVSLAALFGAYLAVRQDLLYYTFGFEGAPVYAGIFMLTVLAQPAAFFLKPLGAMISRHFERQADDYSVALMGSPGPLIRALTRLAAQNLSNLDPHPAYAWFSYSHPPTVERIRRLKQKGDTTRAVAE